jgi:hypothetical protein
VTTRQRTLTSRFLAAALAALAVGPATLVPASTALAAPEPNPVPTRWQLDITPGPVRILTVQIPDEGPRAFYYMSYKVVNNTGEDLYFAPVFELATDEGELLRGGRNVPSVAVREAMNRLGNPFMVEPIQAIGTLQQGEENAIETIAIWPAPNLSVDRVTVYAAGFSGETKRIVKPAIVVVEGDEEEPSTEVLLRKTLMLVHETPGDLTRQGNNPLTRIEQRWILR